MATSNNDNGAAKTRTKLLAAFAAAVAASGLVAGSSYPAIAQGQAGDNKVGNAEGDQKAITGSNDSNNSDGGNTSAASDNGASAGGLSKSNNASGQQGGEDDGDAGGDSVPLPPQEQEPENQTTTAATAAGASDDNQTGVATANASNGERDAGAARNATNATVAASPAGSGDNNTGASIEVSDSQVEQGSALAIAGDGFEPNAPVQVFISNMQVTNVITNVQGSFNTVVTVPTSVNADSAEVVVQTQQTSIAEDVTIISQAEDGAGDGRLTTVRFTAVSAENNARTLSGAPVTVIDTSTGRVVETGKTPLQVSDLEEGTYSVFYSDFARFDFASASSGRWIDTPDGGAGIIVVREGRDSAVTVTAIYDRSQTGPAPSQPAQNSLTLRAVDADGNPVRGMFVTVYDAETGDKIEQGFTELRIGSLAAGTYPVFFANFGQLEFASASPGNWV